MTATTGNRSRSALTVHTGCASLAVVLLMALSVHAQTVGTAFTYQGQLMDAGAPANGRYDLQFTLYNASGVVVSGPLDMPGEQVLQGLFVVDLDFPGNPFRGDARFLEVAVRAYGSAGAFTTLSPRQELKPTPYATTAVKTIGVDGHSLNAVDGSPLDAVYVDPDGQVGIGTQTPAERLDVIGTVKTDGLQLGSSATAGHVLTANSHGIGTWQAPAGSTNSPWQTDGEDNIYYGDGYVGVHMASTTPPLQPLHVAGNAYFEENVGIGEPRPAHKLHVSTADGSAIVGTTTAAGSGPSGVHGEATGAYQHGVRGRARGAGGTAVTGESDYGIGVKGYTETGSYPAVMGHQESEDSPGVAVEGYVPNAVSGTAIYGHADGNNARGVVGEVHGSGGYGVRGVAAGGTGVAGESSATAGGRGVAGWIESSTGIGVMGQNDAPTGDAIAVKGVSGSSTGYGGYFVGRGYFSEDVVGGNFSYTQPRERTISFPVCAFVPMTSDDITNGWWYTYFNGVLSVFDDPPSLTVRFQAPVHLPDGAVVTQMTAYVADGHPDYDLEVGLYRTNHAHIEYGPEDMAVLSTTGAQEILQTLTGPSVSWPIDNATYGYYLDVAPDEDEYWSILLSLRSVVLHYTVPEPD